MSKRKILTSRPKGYASNTAIKKRPLVFVDLEFSGLELNHEILQIGCVVVDQKSMRIVREWKRNVAPKHLKNADKKALKVIGYSKERFAKPISAPRALREFNKVAEGGVLVGYNIAWDFLFLKKAYFDNRIKPTFHWQILDVLSMAFTTLYKTKLKGLRMREVAEFLGIQNGHWHDAFADAKITFDIFQKLIEYKKNHHG